MAAAAQTGKGSVRKAKPLPVKTTLDNPYSIGWSPLEREDMHFILQVLRDKFAEIRLEKIERPKRKKKGFTEEQKAKDEGDQPGGGLRKAVSGEAKGEGDQLGDGLSKLASEEAEETEECYGWTNLEARKQLSLGINEVTRALERDELCLVLVCKSVKPAIMTSHLIQLSGSRAVPACQVPRLSENVAPLIGLKSVLALGFRRNAGKFVDAINSIIPKVPPLQVPWIQHTKAEEAAIKEALCPSGDKGVVEAKGTAAADMALTPSQKRKHTELELEVNKESVLQLQPLKVKKLVPNPNKFRKVKKKQKK